MQERRRRVVEKEKTPSGNQVQVPEIYWAELIQKGRGMLCEAALAAPHGLHSLIVPFLNQDLMVDMKKKCVMRIGARGPVEVQEPLLILICLVYLLKVTQTGLSHDLVTVQDLKGSHFFQGPHAIDVVPLIKRFGHDLEGFQKAAELIGGVRASMADEAYRINTFPKVPVYYLLWLGDDEFDPRVSILFDRSIENHLSADAIWGLVKLVSAALLDSHKTMEGEHIER